MDARLVAPGKGKSKTTGKSDFVLFFKNKQTYFCLFILKKDASILNEINYLEYISQSGMNIKMACNLMHFETCLIIYKILI